MIGTLMDEYVNYCDCDGLKDVWTERVRRLFV